MSAAAGSFDEILVFEGIAERTGRSVERGEAHGRVAACKSLTALTAKSRLLGDGYYYLRVGAWPAGESSIDTKQRWSPAGS